MFAPWDSTLADDDDDDDNIDDDEDDDDDVGASTVGRGNSSSSQFIDMSSGRRAHRRNLGLRSNVRKKKSCQS